MTTIKSTQVKDFLKNQINNELLKSLNNLSNSTNEISKEYGRKLIKEYNRIKMDKGLLDLMLTKIMKVILSDVPENVYTVDYIETHVANYLSFINHSDLLKELQDKEVEENQAKASDKNENKQTDNIAQSIVKFAKDRVIRDLNNVEQIAKEIDRILAESDDMALRITLWAIMLDNEFFLDVIANEYIKMVEQADLKDITIKNYIKQYTEKHLRDMFSF